MAVGENGAVLVTGASTGIGRATVLELDAKGYRVFAGVRKKADGDALVEAAIGNLTPVTIDVTKAGTIKAARTKIARAVGAEGLTGLVNNAGIALGGPIETVPMEDFRSIIDINLHGSVETTQAFLPLVRKARGTVVFVTSIGGRVASPFFGPYSASKFALEAVADCLRREVSPWGIRVVVVEPGSVATPIWDKGSESSKAARKKQSAAAEKLYKRALDRMLELTDETRDRGIPPEKVAEVIRNAIASSRPKARYIVGRDAKVMAKASSLLGERRFDKLVRSQMKLPDDAPEPAPARKKPRASATPAKKD